MKLTHKEIKFQKESENWARVLKFAGAHQEERWITSASLSESETPVCPICADLEKLGWVEFGLLPPFKQAHSIIGEGKWNCPDSSCNCRKGYRRVAGESTGVIPLSGNTGANPLSSYFSKVESDKEKIEKLKLKYKNFNCTCK